MVLYALTFSPFSSQPTVFCLQGLPCLFMKASGLKATDRPRQTVYLPGQFICFTSAVGHQITQLVFLFNNCLLENVSLILAESGQEVRGEL
jgi:hypothetical protein